MERRMDIGLAPFHDLAQFRPIIHLLKFHQFHRRTGDDHAVKLPVLQFIEGLIECQQMLLRNILGLMGGHMHQFKMDLQGCITQQTGKLGLCGNLGRHQVQQHDLQRTDILTGGSAFRHNKNILLLQRSGSR